MMAGTEWHSSDFLPLILLQELHLESIDKVLYLPRLSHYNSFFKVVVRGRPASTNKANFLCQTDAQYCYYALGGVTLAKGMFRPFTDLYFY